MRRILKSLGIISGVAAVTLMLIGLWGVVQDSRPEAEQPVFREATTTTSVATSTEQDTSPEPSNDSQPPLTNTEPKPVTPTPTPITKPAIPLPSTPVVNLDYSVGIAMGETLTVVSEAELRRQLDDIASLGVGWIRVDLSWSTIQYAGEGKYAWGAFDRIVHEARLRNLEVLPILTYTPRWARADSCNHTDKCPPADTAQFAQFVLAAAARYAPQGVHTWEIWNEPNLKLFWASGADAKSYVALLKASYIAIHKVDASAIVVSGGLSPAANGDGNRAPRNFLEEMYEQGARPYLDAVGFHPYSFPHSPSYYHKSSAWSQMLETEWSMRSIMKDAGDTDKKIWLTEFGAPTGGPGSEADDNGFSFWSSPDHVTMGYQERMLREAIEATRTYSWDGPLFWYSYRDLGTSQNTVENHFGLLRNDGSKKPAYNTLRRLLTGE